ncbi:MULTISPECIES: hypothetical protein [unclassified Streptomyces]|uniref:hypothetical protein n=1 Tax=unclassified Streptomyces TaxID=2593676 RepID=UPI000DC33519|nr:hypothetical protein [Streptomyces sp. PsTaAH-137]RAJ88430.1 hypothetical protein K377_01882 [Streptomyces sp. PsTaAH-137]
MHSRNVRIAAGAAAAVAALAVSGCSGDDGGSDKGAAGSSSAAAPTAGSSDGASGSDSGSGSSKDPVGIWSATTDGKPVVLVIGGQQASLSTGDGHLCTGTLAGEETLSLRCADGDTTRTAGTIESNDGSTMKVSWKAGAQDTFKKSANGQLPTDLPTSLPSGLPTG